MNIAMFTNNYKPMIGGVTISIDRLATSLRQEGHKVYIFAPTFPNQEDEDNVIRFKSSNFNPFKYENVAMPHPFDIQLEKQFKTLQIDIIHSHHPTHAGWVAQYLSKKYDVPIIFTYHTRYEQYLHHIKAFDKINTISKREDHWASNICLKLVNGIQNTLVPHYMKYYCNKCDYIFAPTKTISNYLIEEGVSRPVKIIPTGIPEEFYNCYSINSNYIRQAYQKDKKFLFCMVSRISQEKNIDFLLEGLCELKKHIGDCFNVLIIGDGPALKGMIKKAESLNLSENIFFLGSIANDELPNYYKACDLFLFTSKSETQGIVLLEAMSSYNPVVAIKSMGVVDVVVDGVNGFMSSDDIEDWVLKIENLTSNGQLLDDLKEGAFTTSKQYQCESISKKVLESYESLLKCNQSIEYKEDLCTQSA